MEQSVNNQIASIERRLERLEDSFAKRMDTLEQKIEAIDTRLNDKRDRDIRDRRTTVRWTITTIASFIVGGGFQGILQIIGSLLRR